ncbi:MAG: TrkH family potassium uptake protein [Lachnospiraceae bacterium]|nr:TrkH family potassium uptake protein [Lachnospiraceae bacterium]
MGNTIIRYILGQVLKIQAILMLLPCLVALIYREHVGVYYFATAAGCALFGMLMTLRKPTQAVFYLKEGCITTSLSWILLSVFGAIPLFLSGEIPSFIDALFESVSGLTTTGATILSDVEALSHCSLFWRSFSHWIGGMGVLVFMLAIIPLSGGSNMNLMRAESPGPSVGKLVPKIRYTARILYIIYFSMTLAAILMLALGGMPLFDAVNTALATAGTGGFSIKADSMAGYSAYIQWVVTVFMILFGINFNAYYLLLFRNFRKAFGMEEVRYYLLTILVSTGIIFANIVNTSSSAFRALTDAAFQVASIMTSTGFSTADFNLWPHTSQTLLVLIMFIGACAGSTGGGIKVSRIMILLKSLRKEITSYIHPKSIKKIRIEGKPVEHEVVRSVNVYIITYLIIFVVSVFLISIEERDLVTNFTAVAATINNTGPGLSMVGPVENFGFFCGFSKFVLMLDMLAGRLELFPLLILFYPAAWKNVWIRKKQPSP